MWKRRGPLTQLAAWMPGMEVRAVGSVRRSTAWNEGGGCRSCLRAEPKT